MTKTTDQPSAKETSSSSSNASESVLGMLKSVIMAVVNTVKNPPALIITLLFLGFLLLSLTLNGCSMEESQVGISTGIGVPPSSICGNTESSTSENAPVNQSNM